MRILVAWNDSEIQNNDFSQKIISKDFQCGKKEELVNLLRPRQVPESTPLVEYLLMRSVQNANEKDLQTFASIISENKLHSRFFNTYPSGDLNIVEWLCCWMKKGEKLFPFTIFCQRIYCDLQFKLILICTCIVIIRGCSRRH